MNHAVLYDQDFHAWAEKQAEYLRAGQFDLMDIRNIAEEIESMGRSEKRELISRLATLLMHLLKWQFQPHRRTRSWRLTIEEQRRKAARHLADNPSLKAMLSETISDAYGDAIIEAERETDLDRSAFPSECPWPFEQFMSDEFWPSSDAE